MKFRAARPSREQLRGFSPSEFKTMLRRRGFLVPRDFFLNGSVARHNNRLYRFRWWANGEFLVDISCPLTDFDRWANSTDSVEQFCVWLKTSR